MELEIKNISPEKLKKIILSSNEPVNFLFDGEKVGKGKYKNGKLEMDFYSIKNIVQTWQCLSLWILFAQAVLHSQDIKVFIVYFDLILNIIKVFYFEFPNGKNPIII